MESPVSPYDPGLRGFYPKYERKGDGVIGRAAALQKLRRRLSETKPTPIGRLLTISGLPGFGKTQLAVEYAYEYEHEYPGGVYWITADQDVDSQLIRIAEHSKWVHPETEPATKLEIAWNQLRRRPGCLLVFDNLEDFEPVRAVLADKPASRDVLATSHASFAPFVAFPRDELNSDQRVEMLLSESERKLDTEKREEAEAIVTALDGLPLAIELAGAFLKRRPDVTFALYSQQLQKQGLKARGLEAKELSSYTEHSPNLRKALHLNEDLFEEEQILRELLDVLAWSGSSAMGVDLLAHLLNVPTNDIDFRMALTFGVDLHLLRWEERAGEPQHTAVRMHRLLQAVRRDEIPVHEYTHRVHVLLERLIGWFEGHREDFKHLKIFEAELNHLRAWQQHAVVLGVKEVEVQCLWLEAYPAFHHGQYRDSLRDLERAWKSFQEAGLSSPSLEAHIWGDLGIIKRNLGLYQDSLQYGERALIIRREVLGPRHLDTATSLHSLGEVYRELGEHQKALDYEMQALEIREGALGPEHSLTAFSLNSVSSVYLSIGENRKALECSTRALDIRKKILGPKHPAMADSLNTIGVVYGNLGELRTALDYAKQAFEISQEVLGPKHPLSAIALGNIGADFGMMGNHSLALEHERQTFDIFQTTLGDDHPRTVHSQISVASRLGLLGRHKEALDVLNRGISVVKHPERRQELIAAKDQLPARKGYRAPPKRSR